MWKVLGLLTVGVLVSGCTLSVDIPLTESLKAERSSATSKPSSTNPTGSLVLISITEQYEETAKYDLVYPEFELVRDDFGTGTDFVQKLNRRTNANVQKCYKFAKVTFGNAKTNCNYTAEVTYSSPDLFVVNLKLETMLAGGAHGTSQSVTHAYSPKTGASVSLLDSLMDGGLAKLADAAREQLLSYDNGYGDDFFLSKADRDRAFSNPDNWQNWKIAGGLQVKFPEYGVGPYAIGEPEVWISAAELKPLLKPDSAIAAALGS